jgi:hypothetical protein
MSNTDRINFYLLLPLLLFALIFALSKKVQAQENQEKINVFAVVSDNIATSFTEAARALHEQEQLESFPLQGYQTHCTLYMTQYPEGMKDQVLAKIAALASTTSAFQVQATGLAITDGSWFFMNLNRNRNLQTLSDTIVELLAPMRAKSDYIPEWAKKSPNKVEFISKYGSPNVYAEFNPHLTFLPKSDEAKLQNFLKNNSDKAFAQNIDGQIIAIGAGIADKNGQIKEPWQIFYLKNDSASSTAQTE